MKSYIVVGLGFGDCGKGTIVNYLTLQHGAKLNIRFNGSSQAAHNVVVGNRHHCFSSFGSGSFDPEVKTLLTKDVLVNPLAMIRENAVFSHKGIPGSDSLLKRCYVDGRALMVTPYHRALNRLRELSRGKGRHGSCGMGVGETMADFLERGQDALIINDLMAHHYTELTNKLEITRRHLLNKVKEFFNELDFSHDLVMREFNTFSVEPIDLFEEYREFVYTATILNEERINDLFNKTEVAIWEGAQGALLDQDCLLFQPNVTWSRTTDYNAINYLTEFGCEDYKTVGVTRNFATRHGVGKFPSESRECNDLIEDDHNKQGEWQGRFRAGYLDLILLKHAVEMNHNVDYLALTHCDKFKLRKHWPVIEGELNGAQSKLDYSTDNDGAEVKYVIEKTLKKPIKLTSFGPRRDQKSFIS